MGGPGASVLLRDPLTKQQMAELESWLRAITSRLEPEQWGYTFWLNEDTFPGPVSRCIFYFSLEEPVEGWGDDGEDQQVEELLGYSPQQSICVSSGCNQDADHMTLGHLMLHLAEMYQGVIDMGGAITPPLKPANIGRVREWMAQASAQIEERNAYFLAQVQALEASLPPGKTIQEVFSEQPLDPNSPVKAIRAAVEAKFDPAFPPELDSWARMPSLEEVSAYVRAMPGNVYEIEYMTSTNHRWVSHIVDRTFLQAWMQHQHFCMIK